MINQIVLSAFCQCIAIAQCLFIDIHLRNTAVISAVIEQLMEHQMWYLFNTLHALHIRRVKHK